MDRALGASPHKDLRDAGKRDPTIGREELAAVEADDERPRGSAPDSDPRSCDRGEGRVGHVAILALPEGRVGTLRFPVIWEGKEAMPRQDETATVSAHSSENTGET